MVPGHSFGLWPDARQHIHSQAPHVRISILQRALDEHRSTFNRPASVMGAVFAGIVRAPMTSVLMIFEMTQDYAVIVPLMIANLVSLFICSRLQREPIYEALAVQDGIHLPTGGRVNDTVGGRY